MNLWKTPSDWAGKSWHGWFVFIGRNRDSGDLDSSNFECALKALRELPDSEVDDSENDGCADASCIQVVSESHWACGWIEWIAIHQSATDHVKLAESLESSLEDYPVLDEDDFSRREHESYLESWDSWGRKDYLKSLRIAFFDYVDGTEWSHLIDVIDDLDSDHDAIVDAWRDHAAQACGWEYDGDSINVAGFLEFTDLDRVCDDLEKIDVENRRAVELTKLGNLLGATSEQTTKAIQTGIVLVSEFRKLLTA